MKATAIILSLLILSSCSIKKNLQKGQTKAQEQATEQTSTKTHLTDKSVTTTTETTTGEAAVPGVKLQSESAGNTTTLIVNGDTLKAAYDPYKHTTKASYTSGVKKIPVQQTKTVVQQNNIEQESEVKHDSTGKKSESQSDKNLQLKTKTQTLWLWVLFIIAVLVGLYFLNRKMKFIRLPF